MKPIIEVQNFGRGTKVIVCGVELGRAAEGFYFDQSDKENPFLSLTLNVKELEYAISSLTDEDIANIAAVARPLIEKKRAKDAENKIAFEKMESVIKWNELGQ